MNPPAKNAPVLTLMPRQAEEVGRLAACFDSQSEARKSQALAFSVQARQWLESLGCLEAGGGTPRWRTAPVDGLSPTVLRMLGARIEALVEITPQGSPVKLVTAFERRSRAGERFIFSGRGPTPESALKGCLFEAIETFGALWPAAAEQAAAENVGIDRTEGTVEAVDLASGAAVRLPLCRVFLDVPPEICPEGLAPGGSNGLAAAEDFETAAVTALLELVERDAVAVWWRSRYRAAAFQAAGRSGRAALEGIAAWLRGRGRQVHLLDLTHDVGLPVVLAVSADGDGTRPVIGAAADLLGDDAAYRALSELVQMEANLALVAQNIAQRGTAGLPAKTQQLWDWHNTASLRTHPFLLPGTVASPRRPGHVESVAPSIQAVGRALTSVGIDAALVRLCDRATAVPVARAVSDQMMDFSRTNARAESVPQLMGVERTVEPSQSLNEEPVPL